DFLPLKCDACNQDFCKDHFPYAGHKCPFAFKKNVQVPVCPLCNIPIPVKRGEIPDVVVGEHIDRDCKYHPGEKKEKVFTYRCSKEGCRKKEMLQLACVQCHGNFCIQHRHPLDHSCRAGMAKQKRKGPEVTARKSKKVKKASAEEKPRAPEATADKEEASPKPWGEWLVFTDSFLEPELLSLVNSDLPPLLRDS
ncbi:AN1-type zinc finger protein 2A, partial [Sciurus carolinensis]|nr:AN1-type zinc finger protein 2A [Sciurus carolinensis]